MATSLEDEIFGNDDDLDALSDLDDDLGQLADDDLLDRPKPSAPKPKKERAPKRTERAEKQPRKRRRSIERPAHIDHDEDRQPEPKNEALAAFDQAVASLKGRRRRHEEDPEMDEMIVKLREEMRDAAVVDLEANRNRQPAVSKLKLLPRVHALLEKSYLHEQILDNDILEVVKMWLEPFPDGSLPAINIRKTLLEHMEKMPITTDHLRESKVGRVIMFMTKCEKELPELRKKANDLIANWSRPLLGSRMHDHASEGAVDMPQRDRELDDGRTRVGDPGYRTQHARIPRAAHETYTLAPRSNIGMEEVKEKSNNKFKRLTQQFGRAKK